jgi:hypothetical protein
MTAPKRPRLAVIGALGVFASASLIAGCDNESKVDVERAQYATQSDCESDWGRPEDCVLINDNAQPASGASSSGNGTGHGAHAIGGHWYGPYYTRTGTVYHHDGEETHERVSVRNAISTTESHESSSSLSEGHGGESVSRGGFGESAEGGGEGGGHGGGEGGGHGGGG